MRKNKLLYLVCLFCSISFIGFAQVTLPSSPATSYTEDFDGMGTSGTTPPTGWTVRTGASSSSRGSSASSVTAASNANGTTGTFYNYPSASPGSGRSLGIRQSGSFGDPGAAFELALTNTSGRTNFSMSIDHLILNDQTRTTTWTVQYSTNGGTSWTTIGTFAGTTATAGNASYSFGTGLDNKASAVYIRIVTLSSSSGSGSRDSYGIDDFSLTWNNAASPAITTSVSSLTAFSQNLGTPSATQSYTVSGSDLTNNITITPPSNYEISQSNSPFTAQSPITLTQSGGTVATTTIYVRRNAAATGTSGGNITNASTGATTKNVAVTGTTTQVSAATDYFRSNVSSGNWSTAASWQSSPNNTNWITSTVVPDFNANTITIRNGNTITMDANTTIDQTVVDASSALNVAPGVTMTLNDGTGTDLTNNGDVVFQSDATGTARLGAVPAGASVSGNVTIERYIGVPSAKRAWRLLTAPLHGGSGAVSSNWQSDFGTTGVGTNITGPSGTTGADFTSGDYSLKTYNAGTQTLSGVTDITAANLFGNSGSAANNPYFIFVRGDKTIQASGTNNTTLRAVGQLQTGTQTFSQSLNTNDYWAIGNPYASPVDFGLVTRSSNIPKRFWAWDANLNSVGGYVLVDDVDGDGTYTVIPTSDQNQHIQSGQAFFVQAAATGTESVTFDEANKSNTTINGIFKTTTNDEALSLSLFTVNNNNTTTLNDGLTVLRNASYSNAVDYMDATKPANINENLAVTNNGTNLMLERRSSLANMNDTIQLNLTNTAIKNYRFSFDVSNYVSAQNIYLVDAYLNTTTPISISGTTTYDFSVTSAAGSYASNRFSLVFIVVSPLHASSIVASTTVNNKDVQVSWDVTSENEVNVYEVEQSEDGKTFEKVASQKALYNENKDAHYSFTDKNATAGTHYYRIKSIDFNNTVAYSNIAKATISEKTSGINIYPNPVKGNTLHVAFHNMENGVYELKVYNVSGIKVQTVRFEHAANTNTYPVNLGNALSTGLYHVEISNANNNVVFQQQIVLQ